MPRLSKLCLSLLVSLAPFVWTACIDEQTAARDTTDPDTEPETLAETLPDPDTLVADTTPDPDAEACFESGTTRCAADRLATEICVEGVWAAVPCAAGNICVLAGGAQCVGSTGDAVCRDTLYCFLGCQFVAPDGGEQAEDCLVDCFRSATQQAQGELADATDCFESNCASEGIDCIADRCSQDLADCYFDTHGERGCGLIVECRLGCGDDPTCHYACGADSTIDAQGDYAVLEICTFYACAGSDDDECPRKSTLPTGACAPYANECIGLLPNTPR